MRARRHRAGRRQAMAHLETLHGFRDVLVERAGRLVGGEVAADDQALAQQIVIGAGGADARILRPAGIVGQPPRTAMSE